ncbi:universal stress protein [Planococcus shenhongbingii]|uniref:Universal stress protein n=1 Tax=Planococcus shenhongbingii TaxID=3058398 RepID=A0ABT8NBT4_9BACL|nr:MULTISPECIES: universal stress protein [unclassified Planococcus (in: firmicutes)]MDN7245351.1 universal stress protein [Planococcus sp. N017]WKA58457.1 universal stress protein [Planococcus sp. N016]
MTMLYKKILVAVDGSKEAELAFRKSVGIAARNQADLYLTSIIDNRSFGTIESYGREFAEESKRQAESLLSEYKNKAVEAGATEVHIVIEMGSPKTLIPVDLVRRFNIDLIICGATGTNSAERIFMGSVSERIVRAAKCDVLIVRTEEKEA